MKTSICLIAAIIAVPALASADFQDGSFETPVLTPGDQAGYDGGSGGPDGWVLGSNSNMVVFTNQYSDDPIPETPDGNQFAWLNDAYYGLNSTVLSQEVALTSGSNTLSFLQADFSSAYSGFTPGGQIDVTVLDPNNDTVVGPTLFTTPSYSGFIQQSLTFDAATAGNYDFVFTVNDTHAALIDGVTVGPTAAPEPASMLGLGLGIAGIFRRASKRARRGQ